MSEGLGKDSFWASKKRQETMLGVFLYIVAATGAIVFMIPLLWMISSSLKPQTEVMKLPPKWIPVYDVKYEQSVINAKEQGKVASIDRTSPDNIVVSIERPLERHAVPAGVALKVKKGQKVSMGDTLFSSTEGDITSDSDGTVNAIEHGANGDTVVIKQLGDYRFDKINVPGGMTLRATAGEAVTPDTVIADMPPSGVIKTVENPDHTKTLIVTDKDGHMIFKRDMPRGSIARMKDGATVNAGNTIGTTLPQFFNYVDAWLSKGTKGEDFTTYLMNTLLITVMTIIGTIISSTLVAYGFARFRFPARDLLFIIMISTMMIPAQVTMIPTFIIFKKLGWVNTFKPLIVPAFFATSAFNIFLLRQFLMTIPYELDDAAKIDGCNYFQIFYMILLPLIKPALATVAIFTFVYSWNDFLTPLIYLNDSTKHTLALGLQTFTTMYGSYYHLMMAASTIVLMPILIIFFLGQRYFIEGVATSGLKG